MKSYNPAIGYLKALGIMLMVLGHSGNTLHVNDFIYMFHMPLFFIASGYCFKEKYLSAPRQYLYNKVRGIYWPYVKWSLLFLLLHNVCFHLNLYSDQYGWKEYVSHLYTPHEFLHLAKCIVFKMKGHEQLLGGYWFMNALFFGSLIAWPIIRYVKQPLFGGAILVGICTVFNKTCWHVPYIEISSQAFAAALLIVIGHGLAKYKVRPFNNWQIALALAVTLIGSYVWNMAMNQDSYSNKRFVPYIITATLATWAFYSLFERMKDSQGICAKTLDFVGKHTLTILTWHFLAFKIVSLAIIGIYGLPMERLAEFPVIIEYAKQGWWVAYFLVAMGVTCGMAYGKKYIRKVWR